jgi:hypothetical protein
MAKSITKVNIKQSKTRKQDLKTLNSDELIELRIEVEREMHSRGISFSVGEIGEKIAIDYFKSTPKLSNLIAAPTGAKNVDALSRNGERYSIKTIQRGHKTGTIYPDDQDRDKQLFEYLLIVKLHSDFTLDALYQFSWKQFLKIRSWDKRMNAWYVSMSKNSLDAGDCLYIKKENNE